MSGRGDRKVGGGAGKERPGRHAVDSRTVAFLEYDLEGPVQPEMSWLPVSFDRGTRQGCYLMRMRPGAATIAHVHPGMEEFVVLEGELIDDDGTVFRAGDFVSYAPGTRHNSRTETGCLIAVFEWVPPAPARPGPGPEALCAPGPVPEPAPGRGEDV